MANSFLPASLRKRIPGLLALVLTLGFGWLALNHLDLADRHHQPTAYDRAVTLAWTQAQVQLRHLGISADEAHVFQRIANRVLYADPTLRPSSDTLQRNHFGPSILWPHGISGDLPIVLVRIDEIADMEIVRQLFRAHEYWRMKQLAVDLVITSPPSV